MRFYTITFFQLLFFTLLSSSVYSQLTINELLADNETVLTDDEGDFDDWIEIHNASSSPVDLAGYYFSDDPADNQLWQIPNSNPSLTTVPANGFLLLWADKDTDDGENHIDLKLGAGGETLTLTAPDGTLIDQVVFGAQNTDVSYGRSQNGGSTFQLFTSPTPNASNEVVSNPTFGSVVLREVNQVSDDAIEYGYSSQGMNLNHFGMVMTETWNTQKIGVRFQNIPIPSGATITSAHIQFTCKDPAFSTGPSSLIIRAQKTNADPFEDINSNISQRPVTAASVNWQPAEWLLEDFAGPDEKTTDLSSIIQEVVNQGSWEAGNNLAFVIEGTGQRAAENFTSGTGPSLEITFEAPTPTTPISNISINEISASGTAYEDENGGKSDWIELYNDNDFPVSLGGLYLTDKATDLTKWQIGASTPIPAKGFLTIFADEEPDLGGFHADFKISGDGETISLVQAVGNDLIILDQVDSGEIPFKTSAGRSTEGANDWILFGTQTPNAPNDGSLSWLDTPDFSLNHGVFTSTQSLILQHDEPGVTIHYTLDSSDPTSDSPIYNGPISIDETMAVRARAFKSGHAPSQIKTKSYLFNPSATLPVVMITTDPDNLYDDEIGIYTVGTNGINVGTCSDDMPVNYWQDWERPAHITFFETDGEEKFAVNAGIKISGNCSRRNALKSLNIYLRGNTYGDGDIDYKLFPNRDFKKFKRLRLRNSGEDFKHTMFRDGTNQQMLADVTDVEYQSFRPTLVYINGEYFGIQNFRELYGGEYFDGILDVPEDELDLVKNPRVINDIKEGDDVHYQLLYNYVLANDLSDPANFEYFKTQFDIENLIDYWITMIYIASGDWPANNLQVWRPRTPDGKWRYMYLDTDGTTSIFGEDSRNGYEKDTFKEILNPNQRGWPWDSRATLFIRKLLENEEFHDEFIQRTCSFMELILNEERAHSFINASAAAIEDEIGDHIERWKFDTPYLQNTDDWLDKIERFTDFFVERPSYFYEDLEGNFGLGDQFELTFGYDASTNGEVLLHWKEMSIPFDYTGTYYTDLPIRIKAVADAGYEFQYWLETGNTDEEINFVANSDRTLTPIFAAIGETCDPTSPEFQDADNDGICDDNDLCPGFDDNVDVNNNGIPDGCDCTDNDGDGVCVEDDCDDNDPDVPTAPGTICDDGNADTTDDVILADGCSCEGVLVVDPCANAGGDADGDGVCAADDCDDNNPNLPTTPGTACDDGNTNTTGDVILADGCSCEGTQPSSNPCDNLVITSINGRITIRGLDAAANANIQIFNSDWDRTFRCFSGCEDQTQIVILPEDTYYVKVTLYDEDYDQICSVSDYYIVQNVGVPCVGLGGDADGDGVCAAEDCDDNNPNVPTTPGTTCDDGDPNTSNDVILADGCSCEGVTISDPCANAGGDADGDGICAADDCDDNNPNVPTSPGTACDDGDSNTENDQIQSDGCTCAGTPVSQGSYCDAESEFPWHDWISNVTFNQIDNESGKSKYSDFTDISTLIERGATYDLSLETSYSWKTFEEHWGVWIDFNSDNVFSNSELVFTEITARPPNGTDNSTVTGRVKMPNFQSAQPTTRMRVVMSREETPTPCSTQPYGEVEDYTVILNPSSPRISSSELNQSKLWLSPNPATNTVTIHLAKSSNTQALKVYNSSGLLIETINAIPEDTRNVKLKVDRFEKGLYFIHAIYEGDQSQFTKLVVMH